MENNQQTSEAEIKDQSDFAKASSDEQLLNNRELLLKIYENTRKTKNYMKWQLYITIALVVVPLLAALAIVPMVLKSLTSVYGVGGLLQ